MTIIEFIKSSNDAFYSSGADLEIIHKAQHELSLTFAQDYYLYLQTFGVVTINSHELTGLACPHHVDVINITKLNRILDSSIPNDWYVIEQTNIDGICAWQDEKGIVYLKSATSSPQKIANSIIEYINL